MTRRRVLQAAAATAAAGALLPLAGCDDDDGGAAETPRPGGTLRFGTSLPFSYGFDPHLEQGGGLPVIARAYGYLFHVDPRDDLLILDHARSVEHPQANVYGIQLGDHRFHTSAPANGRPVTGEDAVLSMRRYRDHPLVTSKFWHAKMLADHGAVVPNGLIVTTSRAYAYSLHEMGNINAGAILPRESTEAQADVRDGVSGSGPMRLADGVSTDLARLERVEGDSSPSLVDAMEWRRLEGASELAAAFADRSIDVLVGGERNGVASDGAEVVIEPGLSWTSIGLRVDRPPFADERVRRALDLAIDRAALMSEAGATDGALAGPVNQHLAGGYWSLPREEIRAAQGADLPPEARIAEARMLLEAAGVRDTTVELQVASTPELIDLAALVREQLLPFGIQLNTVQIALPAWFFNFRGGNFHATLINHPPYETPDPSLRLYHTQGAEGGGNAFGYSSPAIDWLVERSWAEEDREQRRATVLEAQRLMIEARPLLHLFSAPAYSVVRTYVRDHGLHLPGSLARYHYRQWLDLPADGRPD